MQHAVSASIFAALMSLAAPAFAQPGAQRDPLRSPIDVVAAFSAALDAGDTAGLERLLAPDVLIAESGGLERSLEEYRSHHMAADIEFSKAVETRILDRRVYEGEGLVTVFSEGVSEGTFRDKPVSSRLMETMVLRESGGAWKIVHIHWSSAKFEPATAH